MGKGKKIGMCITSFVIMLLLGSFADALIADQFTGLGRCPDELQSGIVYGNTICDRAACKSNVACDGDYENFILGGFCIAEQCNPGLYCAVGLSKGSDIGFPSCRSPLNSPQHCAAADGAWQENDPSITTDDKCCLPAERCDGNDNDCDDLVDEDFPNKGQPCTVGIGACRNTGVYVCKADQTNIECSVSPGTPYANEICDSRVDFDCDGNAGCYDTGCYGVPGCCSDFDNDGYWAGNLATCVALAAEYDCNDASSTTYPGAPEMCDGLDNDCDAGTPMDANCAEAAFVFVTNNIVGVNGGGNLGGLSGADSICVQEAGANPLLAGRTFKAWLSTSALSIKDNPAMKHSSVPYKLVDGTLVATDWNDLTDGTLQNPIKKDSLGRDPLNPRLVWTGTNYDGTNSGLRTCNGWTSVSGIYSGEVGLMDVKNDGWTVWGLSNCFTEAAHLYCLEQPLKYCGNNIKDGSETCDGDTKSCGDIEAGATGDAPCLPDCTGYDTSQCTNIVCGNGVVDQGEQCDDNNNANNDGCDANCIIEFCGDNVAQNWPSHTEACDNGPANSNTNPNACRTNCELPKCGDNVADTGEECDTGLSMSDTTPDACRTGCRLPRCGDGVKDTGERCDDGNSIEGDGCSASCIPEPRTIHLHIPKIANVYKANFTISGTAQNPYFDVNGDGIIDWQKDSLAMPAIVPLGKTINDSVRDCPAKLNEVCDIPIKISADSGTVSITNVDIEYTNYYMDTSQAPEGQHYRARITVQEAKYSVS